MGLGGDFIFFGVGDEVEIRVGEKFLHFEEKFARSGVRAEIGKFTVWKGQGEMLLVHLEKVADLVLEIVLVAEIHVRDVDIEKVFDVAILFR